MILYTSHSTGYGDSNDYSHCRVDSGISQLIGQIVKLAKVNYAFSSENTTSSDYSHSIDYSLVILVIYWCQIIPLALLDNANSIDNPNCSDYSHSRDYILLISMRTFVYSN